MAFSPDGRSLASVSRDGTLRLWDVAGRTLVTKPAEKPGTVTTEMTELGKERCSINLGQPTPTRLAYTRDGGELVVVTGGVVRRFAVPGDAYATQLTSHVSRIESIAAHPDSKLVAVVNNRASIRFFDARTGRATTNKQLALMKINAAAWMPGGKYLVAVGAALEVPTPRDLKMIGYDLRIVKTDSGGGFHVDHGAGKGLNAVACSPDGRWLAAGDLDGQVRLYAVQYGKNVPHLKEEPIISDKDNRGLATLFMGFSGDSKILVSVQADRIRRWEIEGLKEKPPLAGFQGSLTTATLTPDGQRLVIAFPDGRVRMWDLASGEERTFPIERVSDRVQVMTFTHDGKTLATGGAGGVVRLWDIATGRERASLQGHTQGVTALAFAGNDTNLFSGSGDDKGEIYIRAGEALYWDAEPLPTRGASRRFIDTSDSSSRAVVVSEGALVHTSQLLPLDGRGKLIGKGKSDEQAEKVLDNLDLALSEFRSGLDALVKLNVYVSRDDVVDVMNRAMARRFPASSKPAVSFVTGPLPHDALVAVDAVAITPDATDEVHYRTSASLRGQPGEAHAALLPAGARVHVSGQAEKGELAEATRKTLEGLRTTLKTLHLSDKHIVQVKAFLLPMSNVAVVENEMQTFFGKGKVPPLVFVEWRSPKDTPIEIELIARAGKAYPSAPDVIDYITPPPMTASPVFSRVTHIRYGPSIYVSGLVASKDKLDAKAEVEDLFAQLKAILGKADSDLKHLAKATYYVATDETSKSMNEVRPGLYDPKRPPAASKAMVAGVGRAGRNVTFDMIAVPTLKVPTTPPEMGHALTAKDAAEGWISVFDGQTTFGWADGMALKGILERGTTETTFGNSALKADVVEPGVLKIAGKEIKVQAGPFTLAETGGNGVIELAGGVKLRSLSLKPLGLKAIFNGKDLNDWKRIDRENLPEEKRPVWKVDKGVIVATGGPGALEYQGAKFGDIVMQVDVRTRVRHANGGVFFRAIAGDFMNGYEAQVYNRCVDGDPSKPVIWTTGAIDNRQNARRLISRDFETYRMTVIARGAHLSTWINGYHVVDWTDTRMVDPNPRKGMRLEPGVIQLQAHDPLTDVEYRLIQIAP